MNRLLKALIASMIFAIPLVTGLNAQSQMDNEALGQHAEFLVAAELTSRNYRVSMVYGGAKAIDLIAMDPSGQKVFTVQVRSKRTGQKDWKADKLVAPTHIYVFIWFYEDRETEFFVISSVEVDQKAKKSAETIWIKRSDLHPEYLNAWDAIFPKQNPPEGGS